MDAKFIEGLLQSTDKRHYQAKVGEPVRIDLPSIPFTLETEFLVLRVETFGDVIEEPRFGEGEGEGGVSPSWIISKGVSQGRGHLTVHAYDALTGREIAGVTPLDITIDVEEG